MRYISKEIVFMQTIAKSIKVRIKEGDEKEENGAAIQS